MKLGIVIPTYNEEKRIHSTLKNYTQFFDLVSEKKKFEYKLLVVVNGTTDKTEEIVHEFMEENRNVEMINFVQGGKGFAIIKGFEYFLEKSFDLVGYVDADCATPPSAFFDLVENIGNFGGVIANRWHSQSRVSPTQPLKRRVSSRVFNFLIRVLFGFTYRDTQCGAKLFRSEVIKGTIDQFELTEWAFDVNLLYLVKNSNSKINEIPTIWNDQSGSKVQLIKTSLQMFMGILRLRIIRSPFEPLARQLKFLIYIINRIINKKK